MSPILKTDCNVSAALSAAVLLVHAIAMFCVWVSISWPAACIANLGLALSAWAHRRRLRQEAVRRIEWRADGLRLAAGEQKLRPFEYEGGAAPGPYWASMRVRTPAGGAAHLFIPADALEADAFRRLRVWLRWHPRSEAQKGK